MSRAIPPEVSARKRRSIAARWGEPRAPSKTIRIDADAADALGTVPERHRRALASNAIRAAVKSFAPLTDPQN